MTRVLVVAKAPVPGEVKTRLGVDLGMDAAAELAAAALLDTLRSCAAAFPSGRCHVALSGDLDRAVRGAEIIDTLRDWDVFEQRGDGLAERLVHAHAVVAEHGDPVVQVGMDTPQLSVSHLLDVAAALAPRAGGIRADGIRPDAVLGRAEDGGWWVLGLRDGRRATPLTGVAMSTPTTYDDTLRALELSGLVVASTAVLRDVDTPVDAEMVAAAAPESAFARAWRRVRSG